jgi:hypothetical protein
MDSAAAIARMYLMFSKEEVGAKEASKSMP